MEAGFLKSAVSPLGQSFQVFSDGRDTRFWVAVGKLDFRESQGWLTRAILPLHSEEEVGCLL